MSRQRPKKTYQRGELAAYFARFFRDRGVIRFQRLALPDG